MTSNKHCIKEPMVTALVALLPVLFTFPLFEPDFDVGLDSSYVWGHNYLFGHDYPTLTHLLYPYGPLALLKLPVATDGHYAIFLGFYILVKWVLVALTIGLARKRGLGMPLAALLTLPMCVLGNTDTYIVGVVALLVLWVVETRRLWPYVAACVLSTVALAIKISIGAQCCAILFIGWLMTLFQRVRDANAVAMPAIVVVVLTGVGLIVYRSVPTLIEAAVGMLHLVGGYSDALVLEPPHRLWALLLFVAAMAALLIVVHKDRGGLTMFLLLLVPLYANWRHGILREDVYHFGQLVYFACCFATLVALSGQRRRVAPWIVGGGGRCGANIQPRLVGRPCVDHGRPNPCLLVGD